MKRRLVASTALTAGAVVTTLAFGSPAQAAPAGYVKYGSFNWGDQCNSIGTQGVADHAWQSYYCDTVSPSGPTGPGLYNLWVLY